MHHRWFISWLKLESWINMSTPIGGLMFRGGITWCRRRNDGHAVDLVVKKLIRRSKWKVQRLSAFRMAESGFFFVANWDVIGLEPTEINILSGGRYSKNSRN